MSTESNPPKKQTWQSIAVQIHVFHVQQIRLIRGWSVRDTAKAINRSYGAISEYLQLAEYLRAHPEMSEIKKYNDAMDWMQKKKKELRDR